MSMSRHVYVFYVRTAVINNKPTTTNGRGTIIKSRNFLFQECSRFFSIQSHTLLFIGSLAVLQLRRSRKKLFWNFVAFCTVYFEFSREIEDCLQSFCDNYKVRVHVSIDLLSHQNWITCCKEIYITIASVRMKEIVEK